MLSTAKGDFRGAIEAYRKAIELVPEIPELHYNLAVTLKKAGCVKEAKTEFGKVRLLRASKKKEPDRRRSAIR